MAVVRQGPSLMDLRVDGGDSEGTPWTVLSDVAIMMVLILVLFLALQYVQTFRERFILAQLAERQREVKTEMLASVDSGSVLIDSLAPDRQRLRFSNSLLFESCQATLTRGGARLLQVVGGILTRRQRYFELIEVQGHTDTEPTTGRGCDFPSNWELSSARATSVVHLFDTLTVIDKRKLSAVGMSQYRPIQGTLQDLARNRRIEMMLIYDRDDIINGSEDSSSVASSENR